MNFVCFYFVLPSHDLAGFRNLFS